MGLLATMKSDHDLAEALHLEAVLVLDRLPEVSDDFSALLLYIRCYLLWL